MHQTMKASWGQRRVVENRRRVALWSVVEQMEIDG